MFRLSLFYINSGRYTMILSGENVSDVLLYCHDRRIIQGAMTHQMHLVTKLSSKMNEVISYKQHSEASRINL
jgi:hypothetical protein